MSYTAFVDDESHEERRQRRKEQQENKNISIIVDSNLYNTILKSLYNYNVEDIHFIDGNKFNLKKENILIKITAL